MDWKETRRGAWHSGEIGDSGMSYIIHPKRNRRFFVKAYLLGGAEHSLPFTDFGSAETAKTWVAEYEAILAERRARYANEEPIKL